MKLTEAPANPYRSALEQRIAAKRLAAAGISNDDLNAIIRMLAVAAVAGDARALDRIAAAGPALREQIEASIDLVLAEQEAALAERRQQAGVKAAADESRPAEATQPAPEPERESTTTAVPMQGQPGPGYTIFDFTGRPPKPVPPPEFTARRYGLKEVKRGETNDGWMGNR
jgi:hypothetical protein